MSKIIDSESIYFKTFIKEYALLIPICILAFTLAILLANIVFYPLFASSQFSFWHYEIITILLGIVMAYTEINCFYSTARCVGKFIFAHIIMWISYAVYCSRILLPIINFLKNTFPFLYSRFQ